jgi:hypothetical protein
MRSVYGKDCPKHPELAGRRYLPNNNCIGCHSERMKRDNLRRKAERKARDDRAYEMEKLLRTMLEHGEWYGSAVEWDTRCVDGTDIKAQIIKVLENE